MKYKWKKTGVQAVDDMGKQLEKIVRNMNEAHIETRYRYIAAMERYIPYVVQNFKQSKLSNMADKHIESYARHQLSTGKAQKYIKTDLSALRYFHNHMQNMGICKTDLSDARAQNRQLGLGSTPEGRAERAWSDREVVAMREVAEKIGKAHISSIMEAMRSTGMRLDEAASLRRATVERAVRTGILELRNTKGGRPRQVPLSDRARRCMREAIQQVSRGNYVWVKKGQKVHQLEVEVQNFLYQHRGLIQDLDRAQSGHNLNPGEKGALTAHGLRHSYARERYNDYRQQGYGDREARERVAEELGHGRVEVTYTYIP